MRQFKKGFTIIEMVVVMAVFLFIVGAAISIFISVIQNQRRVLAEQQTLNQISYLQEYISKALRMANVQEDDSLCADTWSVSGDIYTLINSGSFRGVYFRNSSGNCQGFYWYNGVVYEYKLDEGGESTTAITPVGLEIGSIGFALDGYANCSNSIRKLSCATNNVSGVQPRITMVLKVTMPDDTQRTFQTTVSRRSLNVQQ